MGSTNHNFLLSTLMLVALAISAHAQRQPAGMPVSASPEPSPSAPQPTPPEDEDFIQPGRPGVSSPAEFQRPGVLQLEFGYDANFRADDFRSQHTLPLDLRFSAHRRLLLELETDTVISELDVTDIRTTGAGDIRLGLQLLALEDTPEHPALAFAYHVKLPSASQSEGLGTGRVDHRITVLTGKKFGETDVTFNAALLVTGREGGAGWSNGGFFALAFSREVGGGFGVEGEVSGQTRDDAQPRGAYGLGALTYQVNRRLRFDTGMRVGLNTASPRFGVFAGMTVGVTNPFHRSRDR